MTEPAATPSVNWSHEAIICLLEEIHCREAVWNIKHPHYPKKTLKRKLFEEIRSLLIQRFPEMAALTTGNLRVSLL